MRLVGFVSLFVLGPSQLFPCMVDTAWDVHSHCACVCVCVIVNLFEGRSGLRNAVQMHYKNTLQVHDISTLYKQALNTLYKYGLFIC